MLRLDVLLVVTPRALQPRWLPDAATLEIRNYLSDHLYSGY